MTSVAENKTEQFCFHSLGGKYKLPSICITAGATQLLLVARRMAENGQSHRAKN